MVISTLLTMEFTKLQSNLAIINHLWIPWNTHVPMVSLGFHQVSWLRNWGSTDPHHPRPASPGPGALLPLSREVAAGPRGDVAGGEETPPGRGRWLWNGVWKMGMEHPMEHPMENPMNINENQWKIYEKSMNIK